MDLRSSIQRFGSSFFLVISLTILPSISQATSTQQIWDSCKNINSENANRDPSLSFLSGVCVGYIDSLIDTSEMLLSSMEKLIQKDPSTTNTPIKTGVKQLSETYCLPEFSNLKDKIYNYLAYIEEHPEERNQHALYTFRRAMEASYPCSK